ncbi:MAG: DUF4012 domain-containing protein [Actinobacteria bacterium]|nr:DUF4012 domain-containing protein [Actinomycetota bacterium]
MSRIGSMIRRRPRRRTVVLLVIAGILGWLALGAWQLLGARDQLRSGADELQAARRGATVETLLEPSTNAELDRAEQRFDSARDKLRSPFVTPLRILPVVGRQIRAADRIEVSARTAADIASDAVADLRVLKERGAGAGSQRVELVRDLGEVIGRTRDRLADVDPGSSDALVRSLHDAIDDLNAERDDSIVGLDRAERTTDAVADMLEGPGTYLLLGANNAEMQAGSGMFLSVAPIDIEGGRLALGDVRPSADLVLPEGAVPVTGDLAENWPWLDPGRDVRQMALTADFPQSAALARDWWEEVPGGGAVDGVIAIDVIAVRDLLGVVGPVEVDGVRYDYETAVGELLRGQYERAGDDADAIDLRRDRLGDVARGVFAKIEDGGWEVDRLASALVELVQRRHLMVWSTDAAAESAWREVDADGALGSDSLSVALINRSGTKLDPFVEVAADVTTQGGVLDLTYIVRNDAPRRGPRYQIGPNADDLVAGDHRAIVLVNVPDGSTDLTVEGARTFMRGRDGPTEVIAAEVTVSRGEQIEVHVSARLPDGLDRLVVEPTARLPETVWTVDGESLEADRRRTVPVVGG